MTPGASERPITQEMPEPVRLLLKQLAKTAVGAVSDWPQIAQLAAAVAAHYGPGFDQTTGTWRTADGQLCRIYTDGAGNFLAHFLKSGKAYVVDKSGYLIGSRRWLREKVDEQSATCATSGSAAEGKSSASS